MSVRRAVDAIRLEGPCAVEDAETLLALLQEEGGGMIDVEGCGPLHLAVVQVLLAARTPLRGTPGDAFTRDFLIPVLVQLPD